MLYKNYDNYLTGKNLFFFCLFEFFFVVYSYYYLGWHGHLPSPFFYNSSDTFMDFFNTAYWADREQRYTIWRSVYPPLNFDILKLVTSTECKSSIAAGLYRDCDKAAILILPVFGFLGSLTCAGVLAKRLKVDEPNLFWLFVCTMIGFLSLPSLYSLERGNLIVICFFLLSLYVYSSSKIFKSVLLGLAINIKPYLVILILIDIFKKNYRSCFFNFLSISAIYSIATFALNDHNHYLFISNIFGFGEGTERSVFESAYYTTSLKSFLNPLVGQKFLASSIYADFVNKLILFLESIFLCLTVFGFLLLLFFLVKRAKVVSTSMIGLALLTSIAVISGSVGGYFMLLLLPFLLDLYTPKKNQVFALFIILVPWDIPLYPKLEFMYSSYLGLEITKYDMSLTLGSYLRPCILLYLFISIIIELIRKRPCSE